LRNAVLYQPAFSSVRCWRNARAAGDICRTP